MERDWEWRCNSVAWLVVCQVRVENACTGRGRLLAGAFVRWGRFVVRLFRDLRPGGGETASKSP